MSAPQAWIPYCGAAPLPAELLSRWNFDPAALLGVAALAFAYRRGGRASDPAFTLALGLMILLFVSPLCALSSALFSARVTHHALLAVVVAPLLAIAFRAAMPGSLALWTGAQAAVFWLWHAPPVYGWALSSDAGYWLMQASLLGSAYGFWSVVLRSSAPAAVASLLATMVQMGLLGALITFAGAPLYAPHLVSTAAWGLSPLEDQQLAGIIMWAPASAGYLLAAMLLLDRYLKLASAPVPVR